MSWLWALSMFPYLPEPQFAQLKNGVNAKISFAGSEC